MHHSWRQPKALLEAYCLALGVLWGAFSLSYSSSAVASEEGPSFASSLLLSFGAGLGQLSYMEEDEGYVTQVGPAAFLQLLPEALDGGLIFPVFSLSLNGMGLSQRTDGDLPNIWAMTLHAGVGYHLTSPVMGNWRPSVVMGYQGRYIGSNTEDEVGYGDLLFPEVYLLMSRLGEGELRWVLQAQPIVESIDMNWQALPYVLRLGLESDYQLAPWRLGVYYEALQLQRVKNLKTTEFSSQEWLFFVSQAI